MTPRCVVYNQRVLCRANERIAVPYKDALVRGEEGFSICVECARRGSILTQFLEGLSKKIGDTLFGERPAITPEQYRKSVMSLLNEYGEKGLLENVGEATYDPNTKRFSVPVFVPINPVVIKQVK